MNKLKSLIGLVVLVVMIFLGFKVAPVYYANYQFEDYLDTQSKVESYSQHSETDIAATFAKRAQELGIPLTANQIKVTKVGNDLTIEADYAVTIDVPIHPFDLNFHVATKNRRI